jgi:hypothetical protein
MTPEQSIALRAKIPEHLVSKFPKSAGAAKADKEFAGHAAVTDRLLEVDPCWTWKFLGDGTPVFDDFGGIWIELTVCGVTRPGYGFPENLKAGNGIKEAIGDAIRNAAMRFGVGLEFWFKGDLFAEPDKGGLLLSAGKLKEVAAAISLVANRPAALKSLKSKIGTDEIDKLTESQFGTAMALISSVPKLTDVMSAQAKEVFYKKIIDAKFVPADILKALNFSDNTLTYAQKAEMVEYINSLKEKK